VILAYDAAQESYRLGRVSGPFLQLPVTNLGLFLVLYERV